MYRKYRNIYFFCKVIFENVQSNGKTTYECSILHNCKIVVQTHTFATCQLTTAKIDSFEVEKKWDSKSIPAFLPYSFISTHFSNLFQ